MSIKPMLAVEGVDEKIIFPVWASPKLDGIRAVQNEEVYSRSGKLIRNGHIQSLLSGVCLIGLDGELCVGPINHPNLMQATSSGVMSSKGEPEFTFQVFDCFNNPNDPYETRMAEAKSIIAESFADTAIVVWLEQTLIHTLEELDAFEAEQLEKGFEGIIYRFAGSKYKFGRSTMKEGCLIKRKRFDHSEAIIEDFEELMHNENEAFLDELGRTKRSENKEGLVPSGMIGAYIVRQKEYDKPFRISCGAMTHEERRARWESREADRGRIARYKFFAHGVKDVPRHGIFDAFRDSDDLDPGAVV